MLLRARNALCIAAVMLSAMTSALPQGQDGVVADGVCSLEQNKAFERQASPILRITPKFIAKPDANAAAAEIKRHLMYSHVLAVFASAELLKSSSGQCVFGSSINASLVLHFELFGTAKIVHDECSLSRCTQLLSDMLQSAVVDRSAFSKAIDAIVDEFRYWDSADITTQARSARRSALEAFRHIYLAGTTERIYVDISADDFQNITFDEFAAWFRRQKSSLIDAANGKALQPPSPSESQVDDGHCAESPDVKVEELNIDHHGWGQRSIIMIKSGFKGDGLGGIDNTALRAFCPPGEGNALLETPPWSDMVGRVSCNRRRISDRDRWLVLYSKQAPAQTGAEMSRYAQGIARVLMEDRCVDLQLKIVVVNFLQQR